MAGKKSASTEYVKKALEEGRLEDEAEGFKRRFAKILYNEKPELFISPEQVRDKLRYLTGNRGKYNRKYAKSKKIFKTQDYIYNVPRHQYDPPKGIQMPTALQRIGIVGDVHVPFHINEVVQEVYSDLLDRRIQCLILNGDITDCASISRFGKDRNTPDLVYELDVLYEFLSMTREVFPKIPIYYKIGNHELRFETLFWQKAPEVAREYTFTEMASLTDFNIIEVDSSDHIDISGLKVYHGHELQVRARVHPAKTVFNKTFGQENILFGHVHKTDRFKMGKSKEVHAVGCLCDLKALYDPISDYAWNHGYAYVEQRNGTFTVENIRL